MYENPQTLLTQRMVQQTSFQPQQASSKERHLSPTSFVNQFTI